MTPETTYGPRLAAYIERHLHAKGLTVNAFADRTAGVAGADFTRWRSGMEPSLAKYRAVADGLGVPMLDVLVAAGVLSEAEAKRPAVLPPSIDEAIRSDPALHDDDRPRIREVVDAFRDIRAGAKRAAGPAGKSPRRGGHRK